MTVSFLQNHNYVIVKTSLVGSVLSNMLLVLGMSFLMGGLTRSPTKTNNNGNDLEVPLVRGALMTTDAPTQQTIIGKEQVYNNMGALINTTMLLLACFALNLVTIFNYMDNVDEKEHFKEEATMYMLPISRCVSVLIMFSYICFVFFQLITHSQVIADEEEEGEGGEAEEETPGLSTKASILLLFAATVVVSVASEFMTGSLEGALEKAGLSEAFVGVILIPIVGNACEHAAAIRFAMQDKAGLSVGIAVGSSVQIALFVFPLSVLLGWVIGADPVTGANMDLNIGALDCTVMTMSVIMILAIVSDGKSNWLEGQLLMTAYAVAAVLYYFMPNAVIPAN